jgi:hypothetical protein
MLFEGRELRVAELGLGERALILRLKALIDVADRSVL